MYQKKAISLHDIWRVTSKILRNMFIKTFYFNPFRECTYVVSAREPDGENLPCMIVDPGCYEEKEQQRLLRYLTDNHLVPEAILITHEHPDHVCGLDAVLADYPDTQLIKWANIASDGKTFEVAGLRFTMLYTPGHKEDCVCYYFESEGILFSGDTLFQESIGRTDLPGGDMQELMRSLARLKQLPSETNVYPGHGYTTTIGYELAHNPYL